MDDVIIVDTPGVLSGEKQRIGRQYDFTSVIEWFAERFVGFLVSLFSASPICKPNMRAQYASPICEPNMRASKESFFR
jgi:hypothetical protein